jgi:hypothetical protein
MRSRSALVVLDGGFLLSSLLSSRRIRSRLVLTLVILI